MSGPRAPGRAAGTLAASYALLLGLATGTALANASFQLQVTDAAGSGFNDMTAFTPVGGNNATTVGEARRNVFNEAARVWGRLIDSNVTIVVSAKWAAMTCSATTGTLGGAGADTFFRDFGAGVSNVWYPAALADALAGRNIVGSNGTDGQVDISATFNSSVNGDTTCLNGARFYYGLDHTEPLNSIDLLAVMLHELGHGLGFTSIVDGNGAGYTTQGVERLGIFDQFVYDESQAKAWKDMTDGERAQSEVNTGRLVWNGAHVNAHVSFLNNGESSGGHVLLYAPSTYDSGSSVSHFDSSASPNLLMEPNISHSLTSATDLTTCVMYDLGWGGTRCPDTGFVNTPPVATPQSLQATAGTALAITLSGTDADGDPLTYRTVSDPSRGVLSGTAPNLSYMPNAGASGADSFGFVVNDGTVDSAVATISLTINPASQSGGGGSSGSASSSGGGGGMGAGALAALGLLALLGRQRRR